MTEQQRHKIIEGKAAGLTDAQVADNVGMARSWVHEVSKKPENAAEIRKLQAIFYDRFLPKAIENFDTFLSSKSDDKQDKYIKYKASKDVLDGAGFTGVSPSIYIQQNILNQENVVLNPIVQNLLLNTIGEGKDTNSINTNSTDTNYIEGKIHTIQAHPQDSNNINKIDDLKTIDDK